MTAQEDPYVRVYYRALTDDRFKGLSLSGWGQWVKLLIIADGMHPAAAQLPRSVDQGCLDDLVERGIVELVGDDSYRIHGLASERERRSQAAAKAANARWEARADAPASKSNAGADAGAMRAHMRGDALRSAPIQSNPSLSAAREGASAGGSATPPSAPKPLSEIIGSLEDIIDKRAN